MSSHPIRSLGLIAGGILISILMAGCLQTKLKLGSGEQAKVDTAYCGAWTMSWADGGQSKSATLIIGNFDGRHYYVEWIEQGQQPVRMNSFVVPIKSAHFAQLTPMADDGKNLEDHIIVRIELADSKLTIRQLNDKFFDGVTTDEQLRAKVESNLDNAEMYAETMTGTKAQ